MFYTQLACRFPSLPCCLMLTAFASLVAGFGGGRTALAQTQRELVGYSELPAVVRFAATRVAEGVEFGGVAYRFREPAEGADPARSKYRLSGRDPKTGRNPIVTVYEDGTVLDVEIPLPLKEVRSEWLKAVAAKYPEFVAEDASAIGRTTKRILYCQLYGKMNGRECRINIYPDNSVELSK